MTDREKVISLLNTAHHILKPRRQDYFGGKDYINVRDTLFRSSDIQLIDAKDACGSYTHVLARLLQRSGYTVRIAQMKCNSDDWGCHILLEVLVDGDWVVLDASYNLYFINEKKNLAGFREVGADWDYFRKQVPSDYDNRYAYADVRYTNWNKIPVLMPLIKRMLDFAFGDKSESISLRAYVLNVYRTYLIITLVLYAMLIAWSVYAYRRGRSRVIKAL
jgi:hypothetical protein